MRQANASLIAALASRIPLVKADLFKFELASGAVYAWTSFDMSLTVGGYVYSALGPLIDRTKWGIKNTIDVPEMEVQIFSTGSDLPDGTNVKLLAHNGLFDYATLTLSRVYMQTPGDVSLGAVDLFVGNVSQININSLGIKMTLKGANIKLAQYMPRNQYMPSCIHSVYDAGCAPAPGQPGGGPARAAYTYANSVGAGSTTTTIVWGSAAPPSPGQFAFGYVTFTSGANEGLTATINTSNATSFTVAYPLFTVPSVGDTFTVTYGCQRNQGASGCTFFNNLVHYRGFPYIPPPEFGV